MSQDHLDNSFRCKLFEKISEEVWDSIVFNKRVGLPKSETGITNDVIASIRTEVALNKNIAVWANLGQYEKTFGSDIDIFVETFKNEFIWYALQAKVLKLDNKYERLVVKSQWQKLLLLEQKSSCIPFYLFYNGLDKKIKNLIDSCKHQVSEKQLGCAIVDLKDVEEISKKKSNPGYDDFCKKHAHPWRELVCCTAQRKNRETYSLSQVQDAVSLYQGVLNNDIIIRGSDSEQSSQNELSILRANELVERNPVFDIVVRTSQGMDQ